MTLTPAQAHLVTIKNDTNMGDFDVTCLCGWKGGSHVFEDQAERARDRHYKDIAKAGPLLMLSNAQAQEIRESLADILAEAKRIEEWTGESYVQDGAKLIIATVIKLSALIPALEKESQ